MEQADVYILVASLAAGGCVFCIVQLGVNWIAAARAEALRPSFTRVKTSSPILRLLRPPAQWAGFLVGALVARIEMKLGRDAGRSFLLSIRVRIAKALRAAGNPENLTPDEFLGLIIVSALLGLGLGMVLYLHVSLGVVPLGTTIIGAIMPIRFRSRPGSTSPRRCSGLSAGWARRPWARSSARPCDRFNSARRAVRRCATWPRAST